MSFVKKAIKKVVKTVKKIVKSDIFKYIVIAAAIFFTAGMVAGGFAAFSTTMSTSGFFTAVGQTIATGASAIAGGLGFQGMSASLAAHGGAMASAAGLQTVASGTMIAGMEVAAGTSVASLSATGAGSAAGSGFLGAVKGVLGKKVLGDVSIGQLAANGITMGIKAKLDAKGKESDPVNGYVAGGLMRGGGEEAPPAIDYQFGSEGVPEPTGEPQGEQLVDVGAPEQTLAGAMAYGQNPGSGIQQMLQDRGPLGAPGYGGVAENQRQIASGGFSDQGGLVPSYGMGINPMGQQAAPGRVFQRRASQLELQQSGGLV